MVELIASGDADQVEAPLREALDANGLPLFARIDHTTGGAATEALAGSARDHVHALVDRPLAHSEAADLVCEGAHGRRAHRPAAHDCLRWHAPMKGPGDEQRRPVDRRPDTRREGCAELVAGVVDKGVA